MDISILPGTCSMAELYLVNERKLLDLTKREIHEVLWNRYGRTIGAIIYNTNRNLNFYQRVLLYINTGFNRVANYAGNGGRVYTYILNTNKW